MEATCRKLKEEDHDRRVETMGDSALRSRPEAEAFRNSSGAYGGGYDAVLAGAGYGGGGGGGGLAAGGGGGSVGRIEPRAPRRGDETFLRPDLAAGDAARPDEKGASSAEIDAKILAQKAEAAERLVSAAAQGEAHVFDILRGDFANRTLYMNLRPTAILDGPPTSHDPQLHPTAPL